MKKLLVAGAAAVTMGMFVNTQAHAADLYTPPPVEPMLAPEPAFNWTGFYIGGHVGWGWARQDATIDENIADGLNQIPGSVKLRGNGVLGGVQAGYNWQVSPNWLVGAEIDWTATDLKDTETFPNLAAPGGVPVGSGIIEWKRNTKWLASLRARLGWTWDRALLYATGGVALNRSKYSGFDALDDGCPNCVEDSFSKTKVGFVLGGGLEYAIASYWSLRAEYLYYRFGDVESGIAEFDSGQPGAQFLFDDLEIHSARVGVNWLF